MGDKDKTKKQLLDELAELHQRIVDLEALESQRKQAEEALRDSESFLQSVFDGIQDGVSVLDRDLTIIRVNEWMEKMYTSQKPLAGKKCYVAYQQRESPCPWCPSLPTLATGEAHKETVPYPSEENPTGWIDLSSYPLKDSKGETVGVIEHVRDITEHRRAEDALRESEERYRTLFEKAPAAVAVADTSGVVVNCNGATEKLTGYAREEIIGKRFDEIATIDPGDLPSLFDLYGQFTEGHEIEPFALEIIRKDGQKRWVSIRVSSLRSGGAIYGILIYAVDVTERRQAEEALRESEAKYRDLVERERDVIFAVDSVGNITSINSASRLWGYEPEDLIGKNFLELIPEEWQEKTAVELQSLLLEAGELTAETVVTAKNGERHTIEYSATVIHEGGEYAGVRGIVRDITERKRAEEALLESEEKLRTMFSSINDGIILTDLVGNVVDVNEAAVRLHGYNSKEEMMGIHGLELIAEESRAGAIEAMVKALEEGRGAIMEYVLLRKDGSKADGEGSTTVLDDGMGNPVGFVVVTRDITERKRAEEALRANEEKYRELIENLNEVIYAISAEGELTYISPTIESVIGYGVEEMQGHSFAEYIFPEDLNAAMESHLKTLSGNSTTGDFRVTDKSGEVRWVRTSNRPLFDGERVVGATGVLTDITEHKRVEEALRESEHQYRALFEGLTEGVFVIDAETMEVAACNEVAAKLYGFDSTEDVIGLNPLTLVHPDDRERALGVMAEDLFEKDLHQTNEFLTVTRDGEEKWVSAVGTRIEYGGKLAGLISFRDVTKRVQAEGALRESEERLRTFIENAPDAIYFNDLDGTFIDGNKKAEELLGYSREELIGSNFFEAGILPEEYLPLALVKLEQGRNGMATAPADFELVTKAGTRVSVEVRSIPISREGKVEVMGIARDITERKRAEERMKHLNAVLRSIRDVNQLISTEKDQGRLLKAVCASLIKTRGYHNAWIAVLDKSGGCVASAETGLGKSFKPMLEQLKRGELIACGQKALVQPDAVVTEDPPSACGDCPLSKMYAGRSGMTLRMEHAGKVFGLLSVSVPAKFALEEEEQGLLKEVGGDIALALHTLETEEERKRAEEALLRSEENYRELFDSAVDGKVVIDAETLKIVLANKITLDMFGFDSVEELSELNLLDYIHPDDRERAIKTMTEDMFEKDLRQVNEFRVYTKQGEERWISAVACKIEYQGRMAGMASFTDVTERKTAELAVESQARRTEVLYSIAQAVSESMDMDEMLNSVLDRVCEVADTTIGAVFLLDLESGEIALKAHRGVSEEFVDSLGTINLSRPEVKRMLEWQKPVFVAAKLLTGVNTSKVAAAVEREGLRWHIILPFWSQGIPLGALALGDRRERRFSSDDTDLLSAIGSEIAVGIDNIQLLERTQELSVTDELTGLYNRRHFFDMLEAEMARTMRFEHPFTLVMLDLDGFKEYNDKFGHINGDAVLKSLGQTLKLTLRKSDTSFRYGGDEFTIILTGTDAQRAKQVIERVRTRWLQTPKALYPILETPLGFSAGIAQFPEHADTADGLVFMADTALYHAKEEGGYRAVLASDLKSLSPEILEAATPDHVYALASTVDAKDPYTYGHSKNVADLAQAIGKEVGMSGKELADLRNVSLLHDIGKLGVPDAILTKPGKLTEEEREIIKRHSADGERIVSYVKDLSPLVHMIRHHHEWYDGSGYPDGLKGEEIPLGARVISIADAYDTMTGKRPYREAVSHEESIEELKRCSGTQFDPELVEAFIRAFTGQK